MKYRNSSLVTEAPFQMKRLSHSLINSPRLSNASNEANKNCK